MKKNWFSFVALIIALFAIGLVCSHACVEHGVPAKAWEGSKDYIGMMITLLGTLIVFVVGYQIYNGMDLKERLKELEGVEKKLEQMKVDFDNDKAEFNEELDKNRNEMYETRADIENYQAFSRFVEGKYLLSIHHSINQLDFSIKGNKSDSSDTAISMAQTAFNNWDADKTPQFDENITINEKSIEDATLDRIKNIIDEFENNKIYNRIKEQLLEIKTRLEQKVQEHESNQSPKKRE